MESFGIICKDLFSTVNSLIAGFVHRRSLQDLPGVTRKTTGLRCADDASPFVLKSPEFPAYLFVTLGIFVFTFLKS